jgi:hypothetical protein
MKRAFFHQMACRRAEIFSPETGKYCTAKAVISNSGKGYEKLI